MQLRNWRSRFRRDAKLPAEWVPCIQMSLLNHDLVWTFHMKWFQLMVVKTVVRSYLHDFHEWWKDLYVFYRKQMKNKQKRKLSESHSSVEKLFLGEKFWNANIWNVALEGNWNFRDEMNSDWENKKNEIEPFSFLLKFLHYELNYLEL